MQTCMRKKLTVSKEACCTQWVYRPHLSPCLLPSWDELPGVCIVTLTDICTLQFELCMGTHSGTWTPEWYFVWLIVNWNSCFWNSKKQNKTERAKFVGAHVKRWVILKTSAGVQSKGFHLRSRASPSTTNLNYVSSRACCDSRIRSNCNLLTGKGHGVTLIFDLCFRCRWKTCVLCVKCFQVQRIASISSVPDEKN